jgi:hypothetical protein
MATILQCDACGKQANAAGREKDEWTFITLAKHTNQGVPFEKHELCDTCTSAVRGLIQKLSVRVETAGG